MRISDWSSDVCSSDLALGGFFGAFAARETNAFAQERWWRLSRGYPGTAELLRALLARGALRLDDLPTGRVSAVLNRGEIVTDSDPDGPWAPVLDRKNVWVGTRWSVHVDLGGRRIHITNTYKRSKIERTRR